MCDTDNISIDIVSGLAVIWEDDQSDVTLLQFTSDNDMLAETVLPALGVVYNGWDIELPNTNNVGGKRRIDTDIEIKFAELNHSYSTLRYVPYP